MRVVDSRKPEIDEVWRRRRCEACRYKIHTLEIAKAEIDHLRKVDRAARVEAAREPTT